MNQLSEAAKAEGQRRGAATQEISTIIPPDVVAILTDGDPREAEREESHVGAHVRFCEAVKKFFGKLEQEEKRYKERLSELEGAMNPDAENIALQRYNQVRGFTFKITFLIGYKLGQDGVKLDEFRTF